jgi:hypothetical protein
MAVTANGSLGMINSSCVGAPARTHISTAKNGERAEIGPHRCAVAGEERVGWVRALAPSQRRKHAGSSNLQAACARGASKLHPATASKAAISMARRIAIPP